MDFLIKPFTVFGIAMVELIAAVPLGFAMRLHPVLTGLMSASGAIVGVLIVVLLGGRIRLWLSRRQQGRQKSRRFIRAQALWDKYGIVGLGLLAPLLTGVPLAAALGLLFGAPARRLVLWTSIGAALWSVGLTVAGVLGTSGIRLLTS